MNITITLLFSAAMTGQTPEPTIPPIPNGTVTAPSISGVQDAKTKLEAERKKLEEERKLNEKAMNAAPDDLPGERAKLRMQLMNLMQLMQERPKSAPTKEPNKIPENLTPPRVNKVTLDPSRIVDAVSLAQNLYRTNDFEASLKAFQLLDPGTLPKADRAYVQYMTGCCLRRMGKLNEAAAAYREVAEAKEDDFLVECAVWQIGSIRSRQELEASLEELRARRKE